MKINPEVVQRILVVKLRAIGDVVLSTVVIRNLRISFPHAAIDFLTEPASVPVLVGNPHLTSVRVYDRATMSSVDLIRLVRRQQYDLIIDLFGNPRTALLTFLSGATYRVGYRFRQRKYAYNILVEPRGSIVHNTQFNLDALTALGVAVQDRSLYFQYSAEDMRFVDGFLGARPPERHLVGVNTGGGWYTKRWPLERYASLADLLTKRHHADIVLLWSGEQYSDVQKIKSLMQNVPIIPPATTLKQLGALLHRCDFLVSNDSGPMHIAAAVGTPVLGIYGPTNPILQGPVGDRHVTIRNEELECLGCNLTKCPIGLPCMLDLSVERVATAFDHLMTKNSSH